MTKTISVLVCRSDGTQELIERTVPVQDDAPLMPTEEERITALEAAMLAIMEGIGNV